MYGTTGIFRYPALTELGRVGELKVNMSVFVGTSSLFRRIFILLTTTTPCEVRFSHISSSLTPSKSLDLITPLHEFREECGVTLIGTLQISLDLRRFREWLSVAHSTNRVPFRNFFTDLRLPANPCSPLSIAKGESFRKAPSSVDPIIRNLGQVLKEVTLDFLAFIAFYHRFFIA